RLTSRRVYTYRTTPYSRAAAPHPSLRRRRATGPRAQNRPRLINPPGTSPSRPKSPPEAAQLVTRASASSPLTLRYSARKRRGRYQIPLPLLRATPLRQELRGPVLTLLGALKGAVFLAPHDGPSSSTRWR